ncbi:UNVERIFIED_CONTAM: hypothetical protein Sradi_5748800 [Sesamum radiatum]|uniref:Uncharacterized protein n=1 Tax=Sesamum radiatum TaxID=300843 RepID=A0AAW2L5D5_SESRA
MVGTACYTPSACIIVSANKRWDTRGALGAPVASLGEGKGNGNMVQQSRVT